MHIIYLSPDSRAFSSSSSTNFWRTHPLLNHNFFCTNGKFSSLQTRLRHSIHYLCVQKLSIDNISDFQLIYPWMDFFFKLISFNFQFFIRISFWVDLYIFKSTVQRFGCWFFDISLIWVHTTTKFNGLYLINLFRQILLYICCCFFKFRNSHENMQYASMHLHQSIDMDIAIPHSMMMLTISIWMNLKFYIWNNKFTQTERVFCVC